jgi:hypothetical protein
MLRATAIGLKGIRLGRAPIEGVLELEEKLLRRDWKVASNNEEFTSWLQHAIEAEFAVQSVSNADGWILSKLEWDLIRYAWQLQHREGASIIEEDEGFESAKFAEFLKVKNWGPRSACVGMPFNRQIDGHSSHWFSTDHYNGALTVYVGGRALTTTKSPRTLTTALSEAVLTELTSRPGSLDVVIYDPSRNLKQKIGQFEIIAQPERSTTVDGRESRNFGKIVGWGPKVVSLSRPAPIWIKIDCAPSGAKIRIRSTLLETVISPKLVTGLVSAVDGGVGSARIELVSSDSGEVIPVGAVELQP